MEGSVKGSVFNLADELSVRMGIKKLIAREILDTLVMIIEERLSLMEEVNIKGLGRIGMVERSSKRARDIKGNREILLPALYEPKFRMSVTFKRRLRLSLQDGRRILDSRSNGVSVRRRRGRPSLSRV